MNELVILGTGGMAREVYGAIKAVNQINLQFSIKGFVDVEMTNTEVIDGLKVVYAEQDLLALDTPLNVVIALTDVTKRESISSRLEANSHLSFPSIIHPSAILDSDLVSIDSGCFVAAGVVLSPGVHLKRFALVNILSSLAHDVKLGPYSVVNPHANVSGSVTTGKRVLIGASAVVHQGLILADDSILGMGAVLTRNTKPNASYFGNPARKIMENT